MERYSVIANGVENINVNGENIECFDNLIFRKDFEDFEKAMECFEKTNFKKGAIVSLFDFEKDDEHCIIKEKKFLIRGMKYEKR